MKDNIITPLQNASP